MKSFWKSTISSASTPRIFAPAWKVRTITPPALGGLLLDPAETVAMSAPGNVKAAVLVPLYVQDGELTAVFTKRPADMRRHAGEISFPGGRRDDGEELRETALREAEEEIGLDARRSSTWSARCRPTGTFVTNYEIYPFVGLTAPGGDVPPQPDRGRRDGRAVAARPDRRLRAQAPDPPRRADQDRHLHGRRPPDLGSNGPHPGRTLLERLRPLLTGSSSFERSGYTSFSTGTATMLPHSVHEPS